MRIGPNGEPQIRPAPKEERITLELPSVKFCDSDGRLPMPPDDHTLPASANTATLRLKSDGRYGTAASVSAVVPQKAVPPILSMVLPGVRSRGPKPLGAKPRSSCGPAEQRVGLPARRREQAALRADHADHAVGDLVIVARVLGRLDEIHVAAEAGDVLVELG